jgi:mxaL protein
MMRMARWPWRHARRATLLVAAVCASAALFLPPVPLRRPLVDALVVIDVTQSMNTLDAGVAGAPLGRLAAVKRALASAVPRLPCGSKLGLGIFTEYRTYVLLAPVETCANAPELIDIIDGIDGRMAWAGGSEIAKGLYSALRATVDLPDGPDPGEIPALLFVTDGHEAPPVNPRHRPEFQGRNPAMHGVLLGVGGATPQPIPKVAPDGTSLGFWAAADVLQSDLYTIGRQGSVANEPMATEAPPAAAPPAALRQAPGSEHLSYLHEPYLRLLAAETGLGYRSLDGQLEIAKLLEVTPMARERVIGTDLSALAAGLTLLALMLRIGLTARRAARQMSK